MAKFQLPFTAVAPWSTAGDSNSLCFRKIRPRRSTRPTWRRRNVLLSSFKQREVSGKVLKAPEKERLDQIREARTPF